MIVLPTNNEIYEALRASATLDALIFRLLKNHEAPLKGPFAVVVLMDEDTNRISSCIAPGFDEEFISLLKSAEIGPQGTTSAVSIYKNAPVYVSHIAEDAQAWDDLPSTWFGIWAAWSIPLRTRGNEVRGALTMYFTVPQKPALADMASFEAMALCIGSAIEAYTS